jgi:3-phenylpropionate/trans-cinnamate dioxygenase ferredoxin subunit
MSDVTIMVTENGSYKVTGGISLVGPDGEPVPGGDGDPIFLCRCGGSTNKPFCDGTHSKVGFQGAMAAVEAAETPAE